MRIRIALAALLLLVCGSVLAADAPQVDVPIYPGGESTMEISLTQDDLLPTLQAMLPMMGGKFADKIDFNEVAAALKDVKRVQYITVDIVKPTSFDSIADFYTKKMPAGDWTRVFWQKSSSGVAAVYIQGQGEKLYAYRLAESKVEGKPIKQISVLKTEGKIDFAKVVTIAGKLFMDTQGSK